MCLDFLNRYQALGFIILRLGIGGMFMWHGSEKLAGGPELWRKIGAAISHLGVHGAYNIFGFMAAMSEFGGGLCLILGLFFRPACFFMFFTMFVAATMHLTQGDGLPKASHAVEAAILFLSLMFIGPGPYNLDEKLTLLCKKSNPRI